MNYKCAICKRDFPEQSMRKVNFKGIWMEICEFCDATHTHCFRCGVSSDDPNDMKSSEHHWFCKRCMNLGVITKNGVGGRRNVPKCAKCGKFMHTFFDLGMDWHFWACLTQNCPDRDKKIQMNEEEIQAEIDHILSQKPEREEGMIGCDFSGTL